MPLGKRTDFGDARYAGLAIDFDPRVENSIQVSVLYQTMSIPSPSVLQFSTMHTPSA